MWSHRVISTKKFMHNKKPSSKFGNKPSTNNRFSSQSKPSFHGGNRGGFKGGSRSGGPVRSGGQSRGRGRPQMSSFDISSYIKTASIRTPKKEVVLKHHSFSEFNLDPRIQANLEKRGYIIPTPIQDQAIPAVLEGRDVIGLAATGTGKTGAFLLPLINKILKDDKQSVLIVAPTRELALQIEKEFRQFTVGMRVSAAVCVGGMPIYAQIKNLSYDPHIVICTPGRAKDLADRGHIKYNKFQNIVLDEVDHMLDMGFIEPITKIMNALPKERQTLFFSATMAPRIRALTSQFLNNPLLIEIASGVTAENVEQDVVRVKDKSNKFDKLHELLSTPELVKVLIFSETKRDVEKLTNDLQKKGHRAVSIHGDKRQRERARALAQFSDNSMSILVATDVAARGLDIKEITHVINYTIPQSYNDYIHRIGRTGRGNSKGKALTFIQ